jgi:uncharacterized protein (TIGR02594 family)
MPTTLRITASSLNLRDGHGLDSRILLQLPEGTKVVKLEDAPDQKWFRVQTPQGPVGWISAKFAVADDAPPAPPPAVTLRVTATTLNLRSGPGAEHAVVAQLPNGIRVTRLEGSPDGKWVRVKTPEARVGWVSAQHVLVDDGIDPDAPREGDPKWYAVAWAERGVKEVVGAGDNPRIEEYQSADSLNASDDEVPWCSSFVNWAMKQAGVPRTKSAAARSWLTWGRKIDRPVRGCVTIFTRPGHPGSGHVALFVSHEGSTIRVLGGNQENQVKISHYKAERLLGFRMPE